MPLLEFLPTLIGVLASAGSLILAQIGARITRRGPKKGTPFFTDAQGRVRPINSRKGGAADSTEEKPSTTSRPANHLPLEERIKILSENLQESRSLMDEISIELTAQAAKIAEARAEAEHHKSLAAAHEEAAEAMDKLVETTVRRVQGEITERQELASRLNAKRNRWQQWLFFLAGLLASIPLGLLVNFVYDLIK
ncbi:hypothetical protein [Saccharothrix sp. NRRL B-16348]|uniref:hypothetical protein n=1 Tax=Saccharothrix sp. NRRL B-16348 TaxID=1415542 RepID=UPI0012FC4815|nr:hypothetical protein [Saccharothrix sp. NRRL B-16348]